MQIKKRYSDKEKIESELDLYSFEDRYFAFSIRHLQTAFYLWILGYVLALACFMIEVKWYRYTSKGRERKHASLSRTDINRQLRSLSELNLRLYS
jgi:predicted outer membrane lipoprotein